MSALLGIWTWLLCHWYIISILSLLVSTARLVYSFILEQARRVRESHLKRERKGKNTKNVKIRINILSIFVDHDGKR